MNRDRIIRNLKTGSTCVTVLCFVLLAVNLYGTFAVFGLEPYSAAQDGTRFQMVEICTRFALSALMLLLAALMFLRLARNGPPVLEEECPHCLRNRHSVSAEHDSARAHRQSRDRLPPVRSDAPAIHPGQRLCRRDHPAAHCICHALRHGAPAGIRRDIVMIHTKGARQWRTRLTE